MRNLFNGGTPMFTFNYQSGAETLAVWGVWLVVCAALFGLNEVSRRWKWAGFFCFIVLPIALSILWFTALKDVTYTCLLYTSPDWSPP